MYEELIEKLEGIMANDLDPNKDYDAMEILRDTILQLKNI